MDAKIYHARVPNLTLHVMTGEAMCEAVTFSGDYLETSDPEVIRELDKICDKPGSYVYTKNPEDTVDAAETAATQNVLTSAQTALDRVIAAGGNIVPKVA